MGVFVSSGGSMNLPGVLFIVGVPLLAIGCHYYHNENYLSTGYWWYGKPIQLVLGFFLISLSLILACLGDTAGDTSGEEDTLGQNLKYELLRPEEILNELQSHENLRLYQSPSKGVPRSEQMEGLDDSERHKVSQKLDEVSLVTSVRCLDALALKCGNEQQRRKAMKIKKKQQKDKSQSEEGRSVQKDDDRSWNDLLMHKPHELEAICQDAAYIVLRLHPIEDTAVSAAISLLALVAGDTEVRRRHVEEADRFGLNVPIRAMRDALTRAKMFDDDKGRSPTEKEERLSAELQRKGCLMLGALCDGNKDIATKIVDEEGLDAVLDAVDWYRVHADVANWSLWSVFILCYDHPGNKGQLLRLGGIQRICRVMKDIPHSIEVARHGIAIFYDLMRDVPGSMADISQVRIVALNAGVHDVVKTAMEEFPGSIEIMLMGQQMLVATGYRGQIPQYQPDDN